MTRSGTGASWRSPCSTAARSAAGSETTPPATGARRSCSRTPAARRSRCTPTFWPEMQDLGGGEIAATPAQVAALELLEQLTGEDEDEES